MVNDSIEKTSISDFLKQTDFVLLKQQVDKLENLETKLTSTDTDSANAVSGVLNFLNGLRDLVVEAELVPEQYVFPEEGMRLVTWPESQVLMDHPDFKQAAVLINDDYGLDHYGSSAYWVPDCIIQES